MSPSGRWSSGSASAAAYAKTLLLVYTLTAPFLLSQSGATLHPRGRMAGKAVGAVLLALGIAVAAYARGDGRVLSLGALMATSGISTVVLLGEGTGASLPRADGGPPAPFRGMEALVLDDTPRPPRAPAGPSGAGARETPSGGGPPPGPSDGGRGALPDPGFPGGTGMAPGELVVGGEVEAGPTADPLERIFNAPTLSEFMDPSEGGFVTPACLQDIQTNAPPGGPGMAAAALAPLGDRSYSAQGVIRGGEVRGMVG